MRLIFPRSFRSRRANATTFANFLAGILACIFLFGGCGKRTSPKEALDTAALTEVRIGVLLPLTGNVASWGKDSVEGIDLAIKEANIESKKFRFKVVYEDSKGTESDGALAAQKFISFDKVPVVIGDNVSGPTMASIPILDKAKVVMLSPSASSPKLSGISPFFFRIYPSDTEEGSFMARTAFSRFAMRSVGILYINNDFGTELNRVFATNFSTLGGHIVEALGYNPEETDFRTHLARLKRHSPDALYLAGYYTDGGLILKQAKELSLTCRMFGSTTHEDPKLLRTAGNAAEGFLYPFSTGFETNNQTASVTKFLAQFRSEYNKEPGLVAALAYDCARLVVAAVNTSGASSDAIRQFFLGLTNFPGAAGNITFDKNGDVHKPVLLKTVRNGMFSFHDPPTQSP